MNEEPVDRYLLMLDENERQDELLDAVEIIKKIHKRLSGEPLGATCADAREDIDRLDDAINEIVGLCELFLENFIKEYKNVD